MSNKNSLGIAHYLNSEKLLTKDTIMHPKALSTTKKSDASAFRKNPPYSLLNQPQQTTQKQHKEMQSENKQNGKNIDMVFKYENELKKKQQSKSNYSENKEEHILVERKISKQKKRAINRDPYQIALEQQQSPTTWQTVVINSSKKYFDSCRMEALNFIKKIQEMLKRQKFYVHNQLIKINTTIEQSHEFLAQSLKQHLYKMIDETVQEWKNVSLTNFSKSKIKYIGQLYELNTQLQERHKQILLYGEDLNSEKEWKNRASDLLTSNYEANLAELSKQCKKSVENTYDNLNLYFKGVETKLKQKLSDPSVCRNITNKIGGVLNSQLLENQEQKQILRLIQEKREIEEQRKRKQREVLLKQTYNNYRYPRYLSTALKGHQKFLKNHIHICEICHEQMPDGSPPRNQIETSRLYVQNQQMRKYKEGQGLKEDEREGENTRVKQYHNQPNERSSNIKISLFRTK